MITCIEPYDFEVVDTTTQVLVIDASLTNETKQHRVKLSMSYDLDHSVENPVTGASIWVEDENNNRIVYTEGWPGTYYTDASFSGKVGSSYVLTINTADGNSYVSTAETLLPPTPIDSIYGRYMTLPSTTNSSFIKGIQFLIDTHDNQLEFSNYRYEYEEDYEIIVPLASLLTLEGSLLLTRDTSVRVCYKNLSSSGIQTATTGGQAENRLSEFPLKMVEEKDPHLNSKYSLRVKQFSITSSAYQYYKDLNENNESAGSFFDKQKGAVLGNIVNTTNTSSPVLGYFEVAGVSERWRIFNPEDWYYDGFNPVKYYSQNCRYNDVVDSVALVDLMSNAVTLAGRNIYFVTIEQEAILIPARCSDCRFFGVLKKPDFWD